METAKLEESHLDHGVNDRTLAWLETLEFKPGDVTVQTLELPDNCADLESALHGPVVGDSEIYENYVTYSVRGGRAGESRMIAAPKRATRLITVVVGPFGANPCVLYTCYGGPAAPREPFEFSPDDNSADAIESREFWAVHALASE